MQRLRDDAGQMLNRLQQAVGHLASNRSLLEENGQAVCSQIETNLGRQAEALRQRECWLVRQVDLMKLDKLTVLVRQEEGLQKALSDLQTCLSDPECSENRLTDSIDRAGTLSLAPEETPFVSYRADSALLREVISQYGRVVCGYGGHFADPARPSTCLPQAVEDEDEAGDWESCYSGQLMAHKPLTGSAFPHHHHQMRSLQDQHHQQTVRIPRHAANSGVVRAWLNMQTTGPVVLGASGKTGHNTKKADGSESFEIISPHSRSSSMREWLQSEKDDDFCLTMCGRMDVDTPTCRPGGDKNVESSQEGLRRHFKELRDSSTRLWLHSEDSGEILSSLPSSYGEKDVDHAQIVAGVCRGRSGSKELCKTFEDCCREENCCSRLITSATSQHPAEWSRWLLDNQLLPAGIPLSSSLSQLHQAVRSILDTEQIKWLSSGQPAVHPDSPPITTPDFHFEHLEPDDLDRWILPQCKEGRDEEKTHEGANDRWLMIGRKAEVSIDQPILSKLSSNWLQQHMTDLSLGEDVFASDQEEIKKWLAHC